MNVIKKKLFLDFDSTIANSIKQICAMYNKEYKNHQDFKYADWELSKSWDFADSCPLAGREKIDYYFDQKEFFKGLEYMDNAYEVINELSEHYDIFVVSMGTEGNLFHKGRWIKEHLPCMKGYLPVDARLYRDKAHINMGGSILVDDSAKNLESSNAENKVCFGQVYEWNQNWQGKRCWNWGEVRDYLI